MLEKLEARVYQLIKETGTATPNQIKLTEKIDIKIDEA